MDIKIEKLLTLKADLFLVVQKCYDNQDKFIGFLSGHNELGYGERIEDIDGIYLSGSKAVIMVTTVRDDSSGYKNLFISTEKLLDFVISLNEDK